MMELKAVFGGAYAYARAEEQDMEVILEGFPLPWLSPRVVNIRLKGKEGKPESWQSSLTVWVYEKHVRGHGRIWKEIRREGKFENPERVARELIGAISNYQVNRDLEALTVAVENATKDARMENRSFFSYSFVVATEEETYEVFVEEGYRLGIRRQSGDCGVEVLHAGAAGLPGVVVKFPEVGAFEAKRWCEENLPCEGAVMKLFVGNLSVEVLGGQNWVSGVVELADGQSFFGKVAEDKARELRRIICDAIKGKLPLRELRSKEEEILQLLGSNNQVAMV